MCGAWRDGPLYQVPTMNLNVRIFLLILKLSAHIRKTVDCHVANQPFIMMVQEPRVMFLHLRWTLAIYE
jgi:hypothetical protein